MGKTALSPAKSEFLKIFRKKIAFIRDSWYN